MYGRGRTYKDSDSDDDSGSDIDSGSGNTNKTTTTTTTTKSNRMSPPYRRVAVIGAGPSGIAAARALQQEACFESIQMFERKAAVGGMWLLEPEPEEFQPTETVAETPVPEPDGLVPGEPPVSAPPAPRRRPGTVTAAYNALDTNTGAHTMAFTHTPLPAVNSAASVRTLGPGNSTRPRETVVAYLEAVAAPLLPLVVFRTHVERVAKKPVGDGDGDDGWVLTLRTESAESAESAEEEEEPDGDDQWRQECFDAVVVASGHFNIGQVPRIDGLQAAWAAAPGAFAHAKSFRQAEDYAGKSVVVVGGNISAADLVEDLHTLAAPPLYISRRHPLGGLLASCWQLPNVRQKPGIRRIRRTDADGAAQVTLDFTDGSSVGQVDKVLFATGYRRSYPFLAAGSGGVVGGIPAPDTNRLAGFYQHVFCTAEPSLAVVGQVDGAISLRVFEYQAVAVARLFAGRAAHPLPSVAQQRAWEQTRVARLGPSERFHEIFPDTPAYFTWLRDFAGPPAPDSKGAYELPRFEARWTDCELEVLFAKARYWTGVVNGQGLS